MILERSRPRPTRGTIVVWGLLATSPFGGMTWQALHYVEGLRRLGFDVWYVEESGAPLLHPDDLRGEVDVSANVGFLSHWMDALGLSDRWIFRPISCSTEQFGRTDVSLEKLYAAADAGLDLCGSHGLWSPLHRRVTRRVLVETDPVRAQIAVAHGHAEAFEWLGAYTDLFTYGRNLGAEDSPIPLDGFDWHGTWPPVVVDWWTTDEQPAPGAPLTTVLNWAASGNDADWEGVSYRWRKDVAFAPYESLPERAALPLELAVRGMDDATKQRFRRNGWRLAPAARLNQPLAYRDYIRASAGEFTPTKHQYVRSRSGWFSDRSVCYLAAGRPVITEETGFAKFAPTGEGLLAFSNVDEAAAAIEAVAADPARHRAAAREIAREHFGADRLLEDMLRQAGLS